MHFNLEVNNIITCNNIDIMLLTLWLRSTHTMIPDIEKHVTHHENMKITMREVSRDRRIFC